MSWRNGKKGRAEPGEKTAADTFVVMLTSLMMILLAFFIMLSTIAEVDQRRKRMALGSLMGSFGIMPSGRGTDAKGECAPSSNPLMPGVRKESFIRAMGALFQGVSAEGKVRIFMRDGKVVVSFRSDVLFPSGVTEVSPQAFSLLDKLAVAIRTLGEPVRIEGHTDSVPGRYPLANWRLSTRRAVAVLRYLREGCDLQPDLLAAAGYADTRPADGAARADGSRHRRVEVVFARVMGVNGG